MSYKKVPRPMPSLDRTPSSHTRYVTAGVQCFERDFEGHETRPPVHLVVFDCDETLTLSTFMPKDKALRQQIGWIEWGDYIAEVNFQSPFITENRLEKLRELLGKLKEVGPDGVERRLAVLTRNESGAIACLNLLTMAKLADHFDVIWSMQGSPVWKHGVYKSESGWQVFEPPLHRLYDHKADVLYDVCEHPEEWFPGVKDRPDWQVLRNLKPHNIVLVDDVRTNFQSPSTARPKVLRYCKVARYDSEFKGMGMVSNMGGVGARNEEDFRVLDFFVRQPWKFKEANTLVCTERTFEGCDTFPSPPVKLVVFDFDETLSLYTFMPENERYATELDVTFSEGEVKHYVRYNFFSPYIEDGDRITELRKTLQGLTISDENEPRTLAVLTKNEFGAVAILNLLRMADLAEDFSVIWTLGAEKGRPNGVFRNGDSWEVFPLPFNTVAADAYKPDVLASVIDKTDAWIPQLAMGAGFEHLKGLDMPGIVLVDDERSSFNVSKEDERVLRYCKVAHYDDEFLDQGLLVHMGGLGAKNLRDFQQLKAFVDDPRLCRAYDSSLEETTVFMPPCDTPRDDAPFELERETVDEQLPSPGRKRTASKCMLSDLAAAAGSADA